MSRKVPEGWREIDLKAFVDLQPGFAFDSEEFSESLDFGLPLVRIRDLISQNPKVRVPSGFDRRYLVQNGDYLVGMDGEFQAVCWHGGEAALNQRVLKFSSSSSTISSNFLFYRLQPEFKRLEETIVGTTVKHLSAKHINALRLPLPPLPEQRRIAEILCSVDEAIQATRAVIEQTRNVKQGVLKRLLTRGIGHTCFKQTEIGQIPGSWKVRRLGEICSRVTSGSRGWAQYYSDVGSLFLRSQNIRSGRLDLSDQQFVNVPAGTEGSRTLTEPDDLLFTITGNSVGNVAKASPDLGDAYVSQHIALVRLHDRRLAEMFVAFFSPDGPGNVQVIKSQYGQSKPGLSLDNIKNLLVPVPPSDEADQIIEVVNDFAIIEDKALEELKIKLTFKSALMSDLLTGRKRIPVQDLVAAE